MIYGRYAQIRNMDISDGPGIRVAIYLQGCKFNCKGCFNKETHDFSGGQEFSDVELIKLINLCDNENIKGLSILGGEPLDPINLNMTNAIIEAFRKKFKDKTIWMWSGYTYENLDDKQIQVVSNVDVLVDGLFKIELKDYRLKYAGSSNQRVIDIKKSKDGNLVIIDNYR